MESTTPPPFRSIQFDIVVVVSFSFGGTAGGEWMDNNKFSSSPWRKPITRPLSLAKATKLFQILVVLVILFFAPNGGHLPKTQDEDVIRLMWVVGVV